MPVSMRFSAHSLLSQSHINTVRVTTAPVNMPDPIQKHFDYGHYGQRTARIGLIVYARSNFPHPFQFSFFNEGMGHTVQNRPGSSLGGLARVWLHSYGLKASWCAGIIWSSFWQETTGLLLVSHFPTRLHSSTDVLDNIIQNQPRVNLVLADCARFWPNRSSIEVSQCARIIQPASGASQQIGPGSLCYLCNCQFYSNFRPTY